MNSNKYKNYYKHHNYSINVIDYNESLNYFEQNIGKFFKNKNKDINIVEIGSGQGKFAYFCEKKGFKNYLGFDLDHDIIKFTKNKFSKYKFTTDNIFEYLKKNENSIDIIFMSHVFEHFTIDEGKKLSLLINNSLKKGGNWINIMPNASSLFNSGYLRYNDITHKVLYNQNSFNQILLESNFLLDNIIHNNTSDLGKSKIKKILSKIIKKILFLIIKGSGFNIEKIYTPEIITLIKK